MGGKESRRSWSVSPITEAKGRLRRQVAGGPTLPAAWAPDTMAAGEQGGTR
jgi:hypothetical protein